MSLINTAYAADTATIPAQHAPSMTPMLVILVAIILFYVWIWRQQSRKTKVQRQFIDALSKGDEIVTTGGIMGKVNKVENDYLLLQIAKATEIMVQKAAVASLLPKGTIKSLD